MYPLGQGPHLGPLAVSIQETPEAHDIGWVAQVGRRCGLVLHNSHSSIRRVRRLRASLVASHLLVSMLTTSISRFRALRTPTVK